MIFKPQISTCRMTKGLQSGKMSDSQFPEANILANLPDATVKSVNNAQSNHQSKTPNS